MHFSLRLWAASSLTALLCSALPAQADVVLTFGVSNVQQNECSGLLQPTCTLSSAGSFTESLRISSALVGGVADNSLGALLSTEATYGFATWSSGTPYTSALSARLSGPVTDSQAGTDLVSVYDGDSTTGFAAAQILTDSVSDTTDASLGRSFQEYKRSYLLSSFFTDPSFYVDLLSSPIDVFFAGLVGTTSVGGYGELGTASVQDPFSLAFSSYLFSEYTGDVELLAVAKVPEPVSLALVLAALVAVPLSTRRRTATLQE